VQYRPLGRTGLTVSALGFGCGSTGGLMVRGDPADQRAAVARALEAGVTYFDTAPSYGNGRSEENLGRTLRDLGAWERVAVGTKFRIDPDDLGDAAAAIRRSVRESLRRLGRDRVDLLQLHSRIGSGGVPASEAVAGVIDGLRAVIAEGLARYAGLTGMGDPTEISDVIASGRFDTVQSYFNALDPSAGFAGASGGAVDFDGLIDSAARAGMGVLAIRVLAAGAVSGTAGRATNANPGGGAMVPGGDFDLDVERARSLVPVAREAGLESTTELGFPFAFSKQGVSTVLVGFSDMGQLEAALRWAEKGPLAADLVEKVVDLAAPGQLHA